MKLTYTLENEIISLLSTIAEKKGEVKAYFLNNLEPRSRETNKIDSVYSTLRLQDSGLQREAIVDILNQQDISAPRKRIAEIMNTFRIYQGLADYNPFSQDSFKRAFLYMRNNSNETAGYREDQILFYYHNGHIGLSVPVVEMNQGMKELFHYLRHGEDPLLIKACLCHYAIQLFQPFHDDNEKMSRLWQTLLLMKEHPAFEFLPWEKEILERKKDYFARLPGKDASRDITRFVRFMLEIIDKALTAMLESCRRSVRPIDRIRYFYTLQLSRFTRKDYMLIHKNISLATATRDLETGVERGFFERYGDNNQTTYTCHPLFE